jgi:hypothetical protein
VVAGISFKKLVVVYPHRVREHASALDLKVLINSHGAAQARATERRQSRQKLN